MRKRTPISRRRGRQLSLPALAGSRPVALAVDDDRVADGFYIEIAEPLLNTAALHAVDAVETTVTVRISTSDTLDPGSYVAPLVASSGQLRHLINLPVEVLAGGAVAPAGLYLPLVAR